VITLTEYNDDPDTPSSGYVRLYHRDGDIWTKDDAGNVRSVGAPFLSGYIYGLELSNNSTDATNDIDVAVGIAAADNARSYIQLESAITKRLDAAWAVGTGNGGLDTGSIANTTYHVFLIRRSDTGVVDVLFSTSATSPTMPTNYDQKRRIGSIIRSGATILAFHQLGDEFRLTTPSSNHAGAAVTAATLLALTVPTGIEVLAYVNVALALSNTTGSRGACVYSPHEAARTPAGANYTVYTQTNADTNQGRTASQIYVRTNDSGQVYHDADSAGDTIYISTLGWRDARGGSMAQSTEPAATNITLGTAQTTTSGTSKDWSIPAGVKRITVAFAGVSTSGASSYLVQLSVGGSVVTTGYDSGSGRLVSSNTVFAGSSTSGFIMNTLSGTTVFNGHMILTLLDENTNTWAAAGTANNGNTTFAFGGSVVLSGEVDGVRLTTVNGTDTFDAGTVNVSWEF
jgi:hypothetical protein